MKQAYLIEIDCKESWDTYLSELSDAYAQVGAVDSFKDIRVALAEAIPVSQSLVWQAKRDASMDKAKEILPN